MRGSQNNIKYQDRIERHGYSLLLFAVISRNTYRSILIMSLIVRQSTAKSETFNFETNRMRRLSIKLIIRKWSKSYT